MATTCNVGKFGSPLRLFYIIKNWFVAHSGLNYFFGLLGLTGGFVKAQTVGSLTHGFTNLGKLVFVLVVAAALGALFQPIYFV